MTKIFKTVFAVLILSVAFISCDGGGSGGDGTKNNKVPEDPYGAILMDTFDKDYTSEISKEASSKLYYFLAEENVEYSIILNDNTNNDTYTGDAEFSVYYYQDNDTKFDFLTNSNLGSYNILSKDTGKIYIYVDAKIKSINGSYYYDYGTYSVKIKKIKAPEPPQNIKITTTDSIMINWSAITGDPATVGYKIYRSTNNNDYTLLCSLEGINTTEYIDKEILPELTYYYKVTAYHKVQESQKSSVVSGKIEMINFKPTIKTISTDKTTIDVHWDSYDNTDYYRLYRSNSANGVFTQIGGDLGVETVSYIDEDELEEGNYYYKLSVVKDSIESQMSDVENGYIVKKMPDSYEDDDHSIDANIIQLTSFSQSRYHTLDKYDITKFNTLAGDSFKVYNKSSMAKKISIGIKIYDFNNNDHLKITIGSKTYDLTATDQTIISEIVYSNAYCYVKMYSEQYTASYEITFSFE